MILKEDLESKSSVRFVSDILISRHLSIGAHNEGHHAKIFVDTGANCKTISRKFYQTLVDQGLTCAFIPVHSKVLSINLVDGHYQ
jgi:hypothetical protein